MEEAEVICGLIQKEFIHKLKSITLLQVYWSVPGWASMHCILCAWIWMSEFLINGAPVVKQVFSHVKWQHNVNILTFKSFMCVCVLAGVNFIFQLIKIRNMILIRKYILICQDIISWMEIIHAWRETVLLDQPTCPKINTVCDFASCAVFWFGYVPGPQGLAGSMALSDAVCVTMST